MKRVISILLSIVVLFLLVPTNCNAAPNSVVEKKIVNGQTYYIETVISEKSSFNFLQATSKSKTASKTTYVKDSKGNILWSVSVTGTFSYDKKTSKCTSCSHSASSSNKNWSIKNSSSSYSGNSATATATASLKGIFGHDQTESVTISCSPSGTIN
ncbi:MAG: hypothetical protein K6A74_03470 [Lachnospiraceae bacterium]|nr:hypothetical protein [Lachnospiraceae bacterium]